MHVKTHIELLGLPCRDKVTGLTGIVESVCFDLYGCVQAIINPGLDKDGGIKDTRWFDIARLEITSTTPVMDRPNFDYGLVAEGKRGPAEKPIMNKS